MRWGQVGVAVGTQTDIIDLGTHKYAAPLVMCFVHRPAQLARCTWTTARHTYDGPRYVLLDVACSCTCSHLCYQCQQKVAWGVVLKFLLVCSEGVYIPPQLLQTHLGEDSVHICGV
jgi:hypothetical protein